jgi:hypothetical protein
LIFFGPSAFTEPPALKSSTCDFEAHQPWDMDDDPKAVDCWGPGLRDHFAINILI